MELKEIHDKHWNNKFPGNFLDKNIEMYLPYRDAKDNLVTAGLIKKLHEIIFVTDLTKSPYIRMKAIMDIANQMEQYLNATKAEQVHCFVNREDVDFAKLLVKNFNFQLIKDIPLVRNF